MSRHVFAKVSVMAFGLLLAACRNGNTCGEGTEERNGVCVAKPAVGEDGGVGQDGGVVRPGDNLVIGNPLSLWAYPGSARCFGVDVLHQDGTIDALDPKMGDVHFDFADPSIAGLVPDSTCLRELRQAGLSKFGVVGYAVGSTNFTITVGTGAAAIKTSAVFTVRSGTTSLKNWNPLSLYANQVAFFSLGIRSDYGLPPLGPLAKLLDQTGKEQFENLQLVESWIHLQTTGVNLTIAPLPGAIASYTLTAGAASTGTIDFRYEPLGLSPTTLSNAVDIIAASPVASIPQDQQAAFWVSASGKSFRVDPTWVTRYNAGNIFFKQVTPVLNLPPLGTCATLGLFLSADGTRFPSDTWAFFNSPTVSATAIAGPAPANLNGAFCQNEPGGVEYRVCQGGACGTIDISNFDKAHIAMMALSAANPVISFLPDASGSMYVGCVSYKAELTTTAGRVLDVRRLLELSVKLANSAPFPVGITADFDRETSCIFLSPAARLTPSGALPVLLTGRIAADYPEQSLALTLNVTITP